GARDIDTGRLARSTLARVREVASSLREGRATAATVRRLGDLLDAPHEAAIHMDDVLDPGLQPVADALGQILSRPHDLPAWVDFEARLGRSERQCRRRLAELFRAL